MELFYRSNGVFCLDLQGNPFECRSAVTGDQDLDGKGFFAKRAAAVSAVRADSNLLVIVPTEIGDAHVA